MIREADRADIYYGIMSAKDPKKQIEIEADLYDVTTKEIEKIWKEESEKRSRLNFETVKRGPGRPKGTKPKAVTKTTGKIDFKKKDDTLYEASKINEDEILRPPTESTWQQTSSADEKPSVAAGVPDLVIFTCFKEYEAIKRQIVDMESEIIVLKMHMGELKNFIEAQGIDVESLRDAIANNHIRGTSL